MAWSFTQGDPQYRIHSIVKSWHFIQVVWNTMIWLYRVLYMLYGTTQLAAICIQCNQLKCAIAIQVRKNESNYARTIARLHLHLWGGTWKTSNRLDNDNLLYTTILYECDSHKPSMTRANDDTIVFSTLRVSRRHSVLQMTLAGPLNN